MSVIDSLANVAYCKIIYYGPPLSGKTTNLRVIRSQLPDNAKGGLITFAGTETDSISFELLPIALGQIGSMNVRLHLYTATSGAERELTGGLLDETDGIVFVADSSPDRFWSNIHAWQEMRQLFSHLEIIPDSIPVVFQLNKRDVAGAVPIQIMNARLNSMGAPYVPASAEKGTGILTTLRTITELVVAKL